MIGYFVTGTDTNVGKTYVTCALARRARARGHTVFAFKPIETGCIQSAGGEYVGADQELLAHAAGDWQQGERRGLYRFALPAAPLVAANAAQTTIDLGWVVKVARGVAAQSEVSLTLVEGAGGWRVPITASADMSTLGGNLGLPVLVVARAGLGTINHTLLTIEAVQRDGLAIAAIVLSRRPDEDVQFSETNRLEILRRWGGLVMLLGPDAEVLDGLLPPGPNVPRGTLP